MVEETFDNTAAATRLATLVATTKQTLTVQLPSGKVQPLYSTAQSGAILTRDGRELLPPVQGKAGRKAAGG